MEKQISIVQRKRIGELLIEAGILPADRLPVGLKEAQNRALRLGEVLVMLRYLSAGDLENVLLAQSKLADGTLGDREAVAALAYASKNKALFQDAVAEVIGQRNEERTHKQCEAALLANKLKEAEASRGPAHRETGVMCVQLGDLLLETGDTAAAENYYRRALQILERCFGRRHLRVAGCQSKLADLLALSGRYKEAEMLYWLVLDTTQAAWGQEHIQVARCHRSLARLLEAQGRLREAEQYYLSSLRVIESVAGKDSPELIDGLRHLAAFWRKQGKRPERKRLGDLLVAADIISQTQLDEALQHCRKTGNPPLGQTLTQLNFLSQEQLRPALQAQLLMSDGVLPAQLAIGALRLTHQGVVFEEALTRLGWSPDTFSTDELELLIDAAEELLSAEAALGPEHAGVAILSLKLADMYTTQARFTEAEPLYKRALTILQKSFGEEDAEVATALMKLAHFYLTGGKPQAAEPLLTKALAIRRKVKGKVHVDVAECLDLLGLVYERQMQGLEAERFYQLSLHIKEDTLGAGHQHTRHTLERLANALFLQNKLSEAEDIFARLIRTKEKELGAQHESLAPLLERLGEIYSARRDYAKAEKQFEQALAIHEQKDKTSLPAAELMEKFAALLENTGRLDQSRQLKERAQTARRLRA